MLSLNQNVSSSAKKKKKGGISTKYPLLKLKCTLHFTAASLDCYAYIQTCHKLYFSPIFFVTCRIY